MNINALERLVFGVSRLFTLIAVVNSIAGALLMFWLGTENTILAFAEQFGHGGEEGEDLPQEEAAMISLMAALDNFLIAVVLLFFAYGTYTLFVRPEKSTRELGLPEWLHVESIGELKQTLAEVIIVVLFVLFLRSALQTFQTSADGVSLQGAMRFLMLPAAILLLAAALRIVELHPKPRRHDVQRVNPSAGGQEPEAR
jgi:uncharacterized membrane protein YqhA